MYQGLQYDFDAILPAVREAGEFISVCTVQVCTNTPDATTGQIDLTDTGFASIPGVVNIACKRAPQSYSRILATQIVNTQISEGVNFFHVLLDGYFPQIPEALASNGQMRAVIDGVVHQLLGVESDSQKIMTRILCKQVGV